MAKLQPEDTVIFRVAIPIPSYQLFDYLAGDYQAYPGARLEVPFGSMKKMGYLIETASHSSVPFANLKPIVRVLDEQPLLGPYDLKLLHWVSRYYHHPLGEVISTAFPAALRRSQAVSLPVITRYALTESGQCCDAASLQRSPKQRQLLHHFQNQKTAILATELAVWDKQWRSSVQRLLDKNLLRVVTETETDHLGRSVLKQKGLTGNEGQQLAIDNICKHLTHFAVYLLEGITGSGKTEVYMQVIQTVLEQGKQVIVLVPEITLTPQLESRFRQRFAVDIALSHSRLTDNQRRDAWLSIQQGRSAILLGTRSALFTPLKNPGLIILDEEHDTSFKQQEGFRFSARDVAVMRGKLLNIPVVLGSATPSLESLHNIGQQRYQWLHLPERAGLAKPPVVQLLDIRNKKMQEGLSEILLDEMKKTLARDEQVLLFLNRRGFAPTLICHGCGWVARCRHCDANLVVHQQQGILRCHHCAYEEHKPGTCPACQTPALTALGLGTERIEQILWQLFPQQTIVRLDRDSTQRKGALENYLEQINTGDAHIILGTQMLAKGHHFPGVTLVAIVDADSGLFSIDFHAAEKLAQMIVQVSGRAGRAGQTSKVILQTRRPDHPLLTTLINEGYASFAKAALAERQQAGLPPFSYQALIRVQAKDPEAPQKFLTSLTQLLPHQELVQILGPVPAPMPRRAGYSRYQLLLQSNQRAALHHFLDELIPAITALKPGKKLRWSLDIDPVDLY